MSLSAVAPTNSLNSINDQEQGSSITQENKFVNNRFNQIGESEVDGDFGAAIQAISKAPLPVPVSTTTRYRQNQFTGGNRGGNSPAGGTTSQTNNNFRDTTTVRTTSSTNFPANHKRLKIKKIATSECITELG